MPLVYPKTASGTMQAFSALFVVKRFEVADPAIKVYTLQKAVVPNSEFVALNKVDLIQGDDYVIDGLNLRLTTQVPLELDDVLVIHYMSLD